MSAATSFASILSPIPAERRSKFRYPLDLGVRFRSVSEKFPFSGAGRAINVSSGGILVLSKQVSQHEIRLGIRLEMSIEWPSLLEGRIPLQLLAVGRILRRGTSSFAASFVRYEFRTMAFKPTAYSPLTNLNLE
jgi:hypothetical protein